MTSTVITGSNRVEIDWLKATALVSPLPHLRWTIKFSRYSIIEGNDLMITITDNQQFEVTISPVDAKGNPAPIEGAPVWSVSDPALLTVTALEPDGLTALVVAVGPLGAAQVLVSADADLGEGVTTIGGLLDVDIVAGQAVSLEIVAGVPSEQ